MAKCKKEVNISFTIYLENPVPSHCQIQLNDNSKTSQQPHIVRHFHVSLLFLIAILNWLVECDETMIIAEN